MIGETSQYLSVLLHVDFCEYDARTILLASVGLAQAHPN